MYSPPKNSRTRNDDHGTNSSRTMRNSRNGKGYYNRKPSKKRGIFGTGQGVTITAVTRKSCIYADRLTPGTGVKGMQKHWNEKFPGRDVVIEALPTWKNGRTEAFKLQIDSDKQDQPTRENYIIDHVFRTNTHASSQIVDCTFSDHRGILVSTDIHLGYLNEKHVGYKYKRVFAESNINSFCSDLNKEVWNTVFNTNNIDTAFQEFYDIILRNFNNNFPLRRTYNEANRNKRWVSESVKISSEMLKDLFKLETIIHGV
nr:unnamed protein product [Callosobruchus analis]